MQDKKVLVIGGRSVIGLSLANKLHQAGATILITSSRESKDTIWLDLTDDSSIKSFLKRMEGISLDGLVIAAGLVAFGPIEATPDDVVDRLMKVNASGVIKVINGLIENLKQRQDPFIVTLSGKIAEIPTTGMAAYSASKAALFAYSIAASRELRRIGIRWIDARPGHTETGLAERAIFGVAPAFGQGLSTDAVSSRILQAIQAGEKDLPSSSFETA